MTAVEVEAAEAPMGPWWLALCAGIAWILISLVVLSYGTASVTLIGVFVGVVLIAAGVNELFDVTYADGWKWLHVLLGILFLLGGIAAFLSPFQTFGILALLIGWYLLIRGTFTSVLSIAGREQIPLWGLLLASGVIEIIIGVWAIGYPYRSAWLLILWVGIGALLRGVGEIVTAFHLRHLEHA